LADVSSQDPAPTPDSTPATHDAAATHGVARPAGDLGRPADDVARTPERESTPVAEAAVVRHAPRFAAFVRTGVLLGAVIGVLAAALTPASPGSPRSAVIALTALALAVLGAIVGAGLAVLADRRSQRRVDRAAGDGPSS